MSHKSTPATSLTTGVVCPSCGGKGRAVKPVTIESLVHEAARSRVGRSDGFRFCAQTSCDVAYFHPETGARYTRSDVKVRIGQKETTSPRPVCYCFDHNAEDIETDVVRTGTSPIPDEITEQCRRGLDRCEETNPQGACCLGNVRRVLKEAQARRETGTEVPAVLGRGLEAIEEECCAMTLQERTKTTTGLNVGVITQVGALASAIVASACCWLPLLLIGVGVSGGALAATFEAWRPVLLPVTFVLLGAAFYFTYRKPKARVPVSAEGGTDSEACCSVPEATSTGEACCPPDNVRVRALKKVNKVMLWVVTAFVLAFAFFPNYVGYALGGRGDLGGRTDLANVVVAIQGMTCEACAVNIAHSLREVPGVAAADVSYEKAEALIGIEKGTAVPREAILKAIAGAGNYKGRFTDRSQSGWTFDVEGMTCAGCVATVKAALTKIPGVSDISVDFESRRATLSGPPDLTEESIRKAVKDAGYGVGAMDKKQEDNQ